MRGRAPGGAPLIRENLRERPRAWRIFAAIERRLEDLPRQLAPRPRSLVPAFGTGREVQAEPLNPLPVRHWIEARKSRELPVRDLVPAPSPIPGHAP